MATRRTPVNDRFRRQFRALLEQAGERADLVARKITMEIHTSLIMKSPVDTGRFRANWQVQQSLTATVVNGEDVGGAGTIAAGHAVIAGMRLGSKVYLLNHLPYAIPLEYGHSGQAPAGMVRTTVAEFGQFLNKAVGEVKA